MNDINRELFQLEPYMMIAPSSSNTSRGVQYVGFVADIVRKLSEVVGFRYELYVAPDNNYGYRKSDGTWNGMVKELLSKVRKRDEILKQDFHGDCSAPVIHQRMALTS